MTPQRGLPVQLTDRDRCMLQSLANGHALTVEALAWWHVPSWRTRWEQWNQRTAAVPSGQLHITHQGYPATTWQAKVRAYRRVGVGGSARLVLTMTHTSSQRFRLLAATGQLLEHGSAASLFSLLENAHPVRIVHWLAIREVVGRPGEQISSGSPQVAVTAASQLVFSGRKEMFNGRLSWHSESGGVNWTVGAGP